MSELPEGWISCCLEDLLDEYQAGFACGNKNVKNGLPQLRMNNIGTDGVLDLSLVRTVPHDKARPYHFLRNGDLLICTTNSAKLVGKCALFRSDSDFVFSNHLTRIRANELITNNGYLYYVLYHRWRSVGYEDISKHWVNQSSLPKEELLKVPVPLAPLNEQHRIVQKLNQLIPKVESCKERLERIPAILKRFRQSVLAAACSGRLTEDWRSRESKVDDVVHLLETISKASGRDLDDDIIDPSQYPFDIPDTWKFCRINGFLDRIQAGKNFSCPSVPVEGDKVGLVKISAVTWDEFDPKETKTVDDPAKINPELFIKEGDFLVSRANTVELVGASVIVREISHRIMLSDKIWRVTLHEVDSRYLNFFLKSHLGRNEIESRATGNQTSMFNIAQGSFKDIPVPIPPIDEQKEIIRRVEMYFNVITKLLKRYDSGKKNIDYLSDSILAKAFRGELVSQDPKDEPASVLLEKIKAERENSVKPRKLSRKKSDRSKGKKKQETPMDFHEGNNGDSSNGSSTRKAKGKGSSSTVRS